MIVNKFAVLVAVSMRGREESPLASISLNMLQEGEWTENKGPGDRFIPKKICANLYNLYFSDETSLHQPSAKKEQTQGNRQEGTTAKGRDKYEEMLKLQLLGEHDENNCNKTTSNTKPKKKKLISFTSDKKERKLEAHLMKETDISPKIQRDKPNIITRNIAKVPTKILDAPGLLDDYYLNLLDWSSNNLIGVGLENYVYIWSAFNSRVTQ